MKPARGRGLTPAGLGFSIAVLLTLVGGAVAGSYYMGGAPVDPAAEPAPADPASQGAGDAPAGAASLPLADPPASLAQQTLAPLLHRSRDGTPALGGSGSGSGGSSGGGGSGASSGDDDAPPAGPADETPGAPDDGTPPGDGSDDPPGTPPAPPLPEPEPDPEEDPYLTTPVEDAADTASSLTLKDAKGVAGDPNLAIHPSVPPAGTSTVGLR